jgi:hypothetical protein
MTTQVIIHGRAEQCLSWEQIAQCDVMIVDPEYSEHTHSSAVSCSAVRGTRKREFDFEHLTPSARRWLGRAAATVKRWSVIYSDVESSTWMRLACEAAGAEYIRTIPWVRWSMPQLSGDRPPQGFEHLIVCHRQHLGPRGGRRPIEKRWGGFGGLVALEHKRLSGEDKHKAEKPLDQALDLVTWFSEPGETVFDPRAGTGTVGLACRLLGRNYVGVEQSAEWAAHAARRIHAQSLSERDFERVQRWYAAGRLAVEQARTATPPARVRLHPLDLKALGVAS